MVIAGVVERFYDSIHEGRGQARLEAQLRERRNRVQQAAMLGAALGPTSNVAEYAFSHGVLAVEVEGMRRTDASVVT